MYQVYSKCGEYSYRYSGAISVKSSHTTVPHSTFFYNPNRSFYENISFHFMVYQNSVEVSFVIGFVIDSE